MGLLEKLEFWGRRKRSVYRHASPLTDLVYYLEARYSFYNSTYSEKFLLKAVEQRIPLLV